MSLYTFFKFVHVVLAIVAIGFNASYAIWLRQAERQPEHAAHILQGIKVLDGRFTTPAYVLLLVTGFGLLTVGDIPFTTFWILAALVLYAAVVIGGVALYAPVLRAQTALAEAGRADSDEYRSVAHRGAVIGGLLILLVFSIEFLMVAKPTL